MPVKDARVSWRLFLAGISFLGDGGMRDVGTIDDGAIDGEI